MSINRNYIVLLVAIFGTFGLPSQVSAQTDAFWLAPNGGSGTWDTASVSWSLAAAGPVNYTWLNNGNERANFGNTAGTVTLGVPITAVGLNFSTTGYIISNGGTAANTLTFAGTTGGTVDTGANTATLNAVIGSASVGLTKVGSGALVLGATSTFDAPVNVNSGILSIALSTRVGGNGVVSIDGGTLQNTNPGNAGSFIPATRAIAIGASGGTVDYSSSMPTVGLVSIYTPSGTNTITGGVLTKTGIGEFRFQGPGIATASYSRLVVNQGLFRLGSNAGVANEQGFGAVPATPLADAITLNGGAIGTSFNIALNVNRGITLGPNGGFFNQSTGQLTVPGVITGGGSLNKNTAGTLILQGVNTYTGATNVTGGTLTVAATGSIASSSVYNIGTGATLNYSAVPGGLVVGPGQTLMGAGTFNGSTSITGGTLAPGASIGTLTQSTATTMTWGFGGQYAFEHVTAPATPLTPVAGTDNDTMVGTSTAILDMSTLTPSSFTMNLIPTSFGGSPTTTVYTAATFGSITTPAGLPTVDLANGVIGATNVSSLFTFTGAFDPTIAPIAAVNGNIFYLQFTPVPEPVHVLLLSGVSLAAFRAVRRKRAAA